MLWVPLGIPRLVDELKTVAVEVGDVGGVVAGGEVGAICRFTFVGAARLDCRRVGGVDQFIGVADDVLLVMGIRASFAQSATAPRWYHAASDPRLGRALQAMHDEPERAWTVPELAHLSAMSRPSFARNFERALGQSPMQYLTDWRLTLARDYLLAGELTLEQIADRTGYSSPNAFAATFRRHVGLAPRQWRQQYSSKPQQVAPE